VGCATGQVAVTGCLTEKPEFNLRPLHAEFLVDKVAMGARFAPSMSVFSCEYHSINNPYSLILLTPYTLSKWQCHEIAHLKKKKKD